MVKPPSAKLRHRYSRHYAVHPEYKDLPGVLRMQHLNLKALGFYRAYFADPLATDAAVDSAAFDAYPH